MRCCFFVIAVIFLLTSCGETKTRVYPAYEDAVKDGAIARGWVPDFVPTDAVNIRESHAVDVGQVVLTFESEDKNFLSFFDILSSSDEDSAKKEIVSIDFPGGRRENIKNYYLYCAGEGIGLLASGGEDSRHYYYFEPLTGKKWTERCKGKLKR